jgi:lipid-A-disaccharide synthase
MVTFYKVNPVSWALGKALVKIPFFCMVNLIAERKIVPELMQDEMTGEHLAAQAALILKDSSRMREDLAGVRAKLRFSGSAIGRAADEVMSVREASVVQVH